jgi:AcrR family transcriptional regulator
VTRRPRSAPKTYHHGDLREGLLEAALAILGRGSAAALTLRAAAREVGVSPAAPYRHFADRDALIAAVAERGFAALFDRMRASATRARMSPERGLQEIAVAYLRFALERPAEYRVMFGPELADRTRHAGLQQTSTQVFALLAEGIAGLQRAGRVRAGDANAMAVSAWALVHGLAMLALDGRAADGDVAALERLGRTATELLMFGMAAPAAAALSRSEPPTRRRSRARAPRR